ncbi:MAG TPA: MBL fold metallo-hydrolase [Arthrobacter sp.]|nr:MBL fold metallo-hydrolase [Arthrobacter sp.]
MSFNNPDAQPAPVTVGRWTVTPIIDAIGPALPAHASFPSLPAEDLETLLNELGDDASNPDRSMLVLASQGFAITGPDRTILVDACLGGPKTLGGKGMRGFESRWLASIADAGIDINAIDTVVNTHLHHDHVGWNTVLDEDGMLRPTFPKARYLVPRADIEHFSGPGSLPQKHIRDCITPLAQADVLDPIDGELQLVEGIHVIPATGHTPGHQIVEIADAGQRVILTGDLLHHPLQLRRPDVSTALCVDGVASAATRQKILDHYADSGTWFYASHLPLGGILRRDGDGYTLGTDA